MRKILFESALYVQTKRHFKQNKPESNSSGKPRSINGFCMKNSEFSSYLGLRFILSYRQRVCIPTD